MIRKIKTAIVKRLLRFKYVEKEIETVKFLLKHSHSAEIEKLKHSHSAEIEKLKIIYSQDKLLKMVQPTFGTKITYLMKKVPNELDNLCEKYGTDKGYTSLNNHPYNWIPHNYSVYYSQIFSDRRFEKINIFECGIGTNNPNLPSNMTENGKPGASLKVWKEYFPNAFIFGADIDKSIIFQEERIMTGYMDQLNLESIELYFEKLGGINFEIMIDDGLHSFESSVNLFEKSIKYLTQTGVYIIEDVFPENFEKFSKYFSEMNYHLEFVVLENSDRREIHDNCLISVSKKQSYIHA